MKYRKWLFLHGWELNRIQEQTTQEGNNIEKIAILTYEDSEEQAVNTLLSKLAKNIKQEVLPALNIVPLYSLLPIPALSSYGHRYLKPFGTWKAIAAIQALST